MQMKRNVEILRLTNGNISAQEDVVIVENTLQIYLDKTLFVQLLCSPTKLEELAVGNLFSEGIISDYSDIEAVELVNTFRANVRLKSGASAPDKVKSIARTVTTGCGNPRSIAYHTINGRALMPLAKATEVHFESILKGMDDFQASGGLFWETGGAHACALSTGDEILCFSEDIGRHNALDKTIGSALSQKLPLKDKLLFTTGRIPSDMVIKAVHAGIPIVISRSAPTDKAIELAKQYQITLCGFVRQSRMNIYSCPERVLGI